MSAVYQQSTLTIAAAHAPSGDIGCFAIRDGLAQLPIVFRLRQDMETPHILFVSYGGSAPTYLPALFDRAWVLQEQLLSRRLLVFEERGITWQCRSMHGSESTPTHGYLSSPAHINNIGKAIMSEVDYFEHNDTDIPFIDPDDSSRFKNAQWCSLVTDFTSRGFDKVH